MTIAPASRPVRISLQLPDIVSAGVSSVLAPYDDRVVVVPGPSASCDVRLVDATASPIPTRRASADQAALLALTPLEGPAATARAHQLGAERVVPVSIRASALVEMVEKVHREHFTGVRRPDPDEVNADGLSPREAEVLSAICRGLSNEEIAGQLYLSINTIKTYIRTAYRKIGATRRCQAVLWGLDRGY